MNEKPGNTVYVLVADLFFRSRIRAVAEAAGVAVQFSRSIDELQKLLPVSGVAARIIIDLNDRTLRRWKFAGVGKPATNCLAFFRT
jgi:hypothetical protein